ncbi:MAG: glycosyltransferase family 4 protein [Acidobacteriota bacterium]
MCIHIQPASRSLGGAEVLASNIAVLLQAAHDVEIVHHRPWLDIGQLADFAGVPLPRVRARYIERKPNYFVSTSGNPLSMYREPRRWGQELAGPADVLISLTHQLPPFNPTPHGVLILLFPMSSPLAEWPFAATNGAPTTLRERISRRFYEHQYAALWRGYDAKLAISEFTSRWARTRWGIDCDVLSPLVDCSATPLPKRNAVLTLGRFSVSGVSKHQREMAGAFARATALGDWRLVCVGEARTPEELDYVTSVQGAGPRVDVVLNAPRDDVRRNLAEARVFWHAAGLGESEAEHPERFEHFGMATVEAMANGCVPVVIGRGGQREVVEHGQSGFLAESLDDMAARTSELAADPAMGQRMSLAAVERAQRFGRTSFESRLQHLVPVLQASGTA